MSETTSTAVTAPAPQPKQELTPFDHAKSFLNDPGLQAQLRVACAKFTTPERIARIALTAVLKTPKLAECFTTKPGKMSIAKALLTATQRGIEVDGRQGHLVPFKCRLPGGGFAMQAEFIPGYQGLLDKAYCHPLVGAVWAEVVYERDEFIQEKGLNRVLVHRPYEGEEDPGAIKYSYAVCEMRSGQKAFVVLNRRDINRIKASSRGAAEPDSPWIKHPAAMWKKSAIRELSKYIPQSTELRDLLDHDDQVERGVSIETMKKAKMPETLAIQGADPLALPEGSKESEPDPEPEPEKAPVTKKAKASAPPQQSEQDQLTDFVVKECGSNWARFYEVAVAQGWLSDSADVNGFDELESAFCISMLKNRAGVKTALQAENETGAE